jgi:hypothetical protein
MSAEQPSSPARLSRLVGPVLEIEINTSYDDQPVRAVKRFYKCPKCGGGHLTWTGVALTSSPPWYPHRCAQCGITSNLHDITGAIVWLYDDPPNANFTGPTTGPAPEQGVAGSGANPC